jgi:hypothetical protein
VESSRRYYTLMIGLVGISEHRLDHVHPRDQCPLTTSSIYSAARWEPTTMDRLAPLIRARGQTGHWVPVGVNPAFSLLTST